MNHAHTAIASLAAIALLAGCSTGDIGERSGVGDPGANGPSGGGSAQRPGTSSATGGAGPGNPGSFVGTGGAGGAPMMPPPRELEDERDFEAPRAGARYVYVANPRRNTVAVIDSMTLAVRSVPADEAPTYLTTIPGKDVAVVINVGSRTATILRTEAGGRSATTSVPLVPGTNALSVAPDGRHAIAWYSAAARGTSPAAAAGSFQDVSVIRLEAGREAAIPLTVGFSPSSVAFSSDGAAAFVVTEDGISIIRFAEVTGPMVAPFLALDRGLGAQARDVSVTPDGKYAIARLEANKMVGTMVLLVDIENRKVTTLDLQGFVTDLDMAPSGAFALAVQRQESTVVRIPIPAGFIDPAVRELRKLDDQSVASATISSDGKLAVLYTTANPVKQLVIANLADGGVVPTTVRLRKAVRSVVLAPDNRSAIVVHTKLAGNPADPTVSLETQLDRSYGYSVVQLGPGDPFAKLQTTPTDIGPLAITPDASRAFVLLPDVRVVQRIHLGSLLVDDFALGSPPQSLAALADSKRVFISQVHPEGRISFIDWESGQVSSVTGFELNGRIVQ